MNELEFLERLNEVEQEIQIVEIKIGMDFYEEEKHTLDAELKELKLEESKIVNELIKIENKSYSQNAKNAIRQQMSEYITQINKAQKGLKLSRDQGMVIEYYLFTQILNDLYNFVRGEFFGVHVPMNLLYTSNDAEAVEINELSSFLNSEIQIVNNISVVNYPVLKTYLNEFTKRLSAKFIR